MGAQKKCQLIIFTAIFSIFCIIFLYFLVLGIYQSYNVKGLKRQVLEAWIFFIISLILLSFFMYILLKSFIYDVKFVLVYKKKKSEIDKIGVETNHINNINNEGEYFIKRTEYRFKKTAIRKFSSNRAQVYKKIVSCVSILSDGKIIFGFNEGTILVCTLNEINCELKQNFSFNKFKLKKIICISESLRYEGEIMVSVKDEFLPIKLIKLDLLYKYSLIKELARDKPYIVFQEIKKPNNNNNNNNIIINNIGEDNYVFKILSFKDGKFLLCDKKGILLKEKAYDLNCDEYISTKQYLCNNEANEVIHDIIKINEDYFATLETKENSTNIYFYKMYSLTKEDKFIEKVITSERKSNRLCLINESLLSVIDNNCIIFINILFKEKVKTIEINGILDAGIDFFYDGGIIFLKNSPVNNINVPYIVKIKKNQGNIEEYNSFSLTNTLQDYKNKKNQINYSLSIIKCLKNTGIVLIANDQGNLFIWEEIDKHKNNNNIFNNIII